MERSQPEGQKPWACACCAMEAAELAQTLRDAGCTEEAAAALMADVRDSRRLLELLEAEETEAFAQRKENARREGEKAGTRLLIPMFGMLVIVIAIVMIPAFRSM